MMAKPIHHHIDHRTTWGEEYMRLNRSYEQTSGLASSLWRRTTMHAMVPHANLLSVPCCFEWVGGATAEAFSEDVSAKHRERRKKMMAPPPMAWLMVKWRKKLVSSITGLVRQPPIYCSKQNTWDVMCLWIMYHRCWWESFSSAMSYSYQENLQLHTQPCVCVVHSDDNVSTVLFKLLSDVYITYGLTYSMPGDNRSDEQNHKRSEKWTTVKMCGSVCVTTYNSMKCMKRNHSINMGVVHSVSQLHNAAWWVEVSDKRTRIHTHSSWRQWW